MKNVNLSGTAIIRIYYRLKLRLEAVFYFIGETPIGSKSYHVLFLLRKYRDKKRRKKDEKYLQDAETVQQRKALQIQKVQIVKKQPIQLEFPSLQSMVLWITAVKDF